MAKITIRYFTTRPRGTRNGGGMRYFWQPSKELREKNWKVVRLPDDEAAAMREAQRLNGELDAWYAGERTAPSTETPGTINAVIALYLNSDEFAEKKPHTQRTYRQAIKLIGEWAGDKPATCITPKMVQVFYHEMRHKPAVANKTIRTLGVLMAFARREDIITVNPVLKPKLKLRQGKGKGRLWSKAAVQHMAATADSMGEHAIGTAILLNEWLGQRKADIIGIRRASYQNGTLHIEQEKTGEEVELDLRIVPTLYQRMEAELARSIEKNPQADTILLNAAGTKWDEYTFTHTIQAVRTKAVETMPEVAKLVFMHLRHTAITRLGEAGVKPARIAAISGHSQKHCLSILQVYNVTTAKMAAEGLKQRYEYELQEQQNSNVKVKNTLTKRQKSGGKNA